MYTETFTRAGFEVYNVETAEQGIEIAKKIILILYS